jgi:YspA, cpYpsA-related SLOG family
MSSADTCSHRRDLLAVIRQDVRMCAACAAAQMNAFEMEQGLAIVGWRGMNPQRHQRLFDETLEAFVAREGRLPGAVISGGCRGADAMGEHWARARGIPVVVFEPDWEEHGRAAGPVRNAQIVDACAALIAFPNAHTGRGTQNSIRRARRAGKPVVEVPVE